MQDGANAVVETPEEAEAFRDLEVRTGAANAPSRIPTFPALSLSSESRNLKIAAEYGADMPVACLDIEGHEACVIVVAETGPTAGLAAHILRCVKYCAGLTEAQLTEQNAVQVIAGGKIDRDAADMHYRQAMTNGQRAIDLAALNLKYQGIIKRSIPNPDDSLAVSEIFLDGADKVPGKPSLSS